MARAPFFRRTFRISRHLPDVPRDVAEEIDVYLELRAQELIDEGLAPEEARKAALAAFGDRRRIEAECRRIAEPLDRRRRRADLARTVLDDARRAVRDLARRPGFALVACLTLAVCVALNAAVFSVVRSILLEPLPFPDPGRLVALYNSYPKAGSERSQNSAPDLFDRRRLEAFDELALYQTRTHTIGEPDSVQRVFTLVVTPSFFRVLRVEPWLGRTFTEEESVPGGDAAVVLSFGLWRELFAGDTAALGRTLRVEGRPHTVVGVMPEGFSFPGWDARLWLPQAFTQEETSDLARHRNSYDMIARLAPGATLAEAREQVDALNAAQIDAMPPYFRNMLLGTGYHTVVRPFHDDLVRGVERWLYLVWGGALFVFLIGGVSLTNLLLVRSTGRLRELATRYVLGAGRGRLLGQLVVESLVLGALGVGAGLVAAAWSLRVVDVFEAYQIPRLGEVALDLPTALAAVAASLGAMFLASALAAAAVGRRDLFAVLRAGSSTSGGGHLRLRGSLAAAQIAVAFVLLTGAGLLLASLRHLWAVDPGFATESVLAGALTPGTRYPEPASQKRFVETALAEIRTLPGVEGAAVTSHLPFSGPLDKGSLTPEGYSREPGESIRAHYRARVSPGYFAAMGVPIVAGRDFDDGDDLGSPPVVVVSEALADLYWPGGNAVGKKVFMGVDPPADAKWHIVVGVAGEVLYENLTDTAHGAFYLPYRQTGIWLARLVVATGSADPRAQIGAVRERLREIDPELPLFWVQTLEEAVTESLLPWRIPLQLLGVFAGIAVFVAAVGVYGVLAQTVAQRTKEIGIRMVLGSPRAGIYRWILRRTAVFGGAGLGVGIAGALVLTRSMGSLLYQVRPADPGVFALVSLLMGGVAVAASLVPARRATRIEPLRALDAE